MTKKLWAKLRTNTAIAAKVDARSSQKLNETTFNQLLNTLAMRN
jgi:hypothetical protein